MTDTTKRPTAADAAALAITECGAPDEIRAYKWVNADDAAAEFGSAPHWQNDMKIPLRFFHATTHGTVGIGWDESRKIAIYSWQPPE
jgi:hypothetical protein